MKIVCFPLIIRDCSLLEFVAGFVLFVCAEILFVGIPTGGFGFDGGKTLRPIASLVAFEDLVGDLHLVTLTFGGRAFEGLGQFAVVVVCVLILSLTFITLGNVFLHEVVGVVRPNAGEFHAGEVLYRR